jgi:DNA-binding IclR family transcriptional regulator
VAKQSAKISRLLKRLHTYGLIAKVPRARRWRLTKMGWALLSAAISLKEETFPVLHAQASE